MLKENKNNNTKFILIIYNCETTNVNFHKNTKERKISTYKYVSAVKFPRLEGIAPDNWLFQRSLFLL